jgi:hypothetical protein
MSNLHDPLAQKIGQLKEEINKRRQELKNLYKHKVIPTSDIDVVELKRHSDLLIRISQTDAGRIEKESKHIPPKDMRTPPEVAASEPDKLKFALSGLINNITTWISMGKVELSADGRNDQECLLSLYLIKKLADLDQELGARLKEDRARKKG